MPIGSVYGVGIEAPARERERSAADAEAAELPLISLLSRALLTFALEYERGAPLSLCVQGNGLRVLSADGVPLRELPARTGVSKEAVDMVVNQLQRVGCVELGPLPGAARGKLARLTADRGLKARDAGLQRLARTLAGWRERYGEGTMTALDDALGPIVGDGTRAGSPLFAGLEPHPDGWRAKAPMPERLPWFAMVTHRGGYPDGS